MCRWYLMLSHYMILYQKNIVSFLSKKLQWNNTRNKFQFGIYCVNCYNKLTRHCNKKDFILPKMTYDPPWFFWLTHGVKSVRMQSYFSRIFPYSNWIRRDTPHFSVLSPNAGKSRKNVDQNNSEYWLFLRTEDRIVSVSRSQANKCLFVLFTEKVILHSSIRWWHLNKMY